MKIGQIISNYYNEFKSCHNFKELPIEYSRDALKYVITKSRDLEDKQCEIITGALEFKDRLIKDIMLPLDRVFMIEANDSLDFETMAAIYSSGFSRIPVYENERNNIIGKKISILPRMSLKF